MNILKIVCGCGKEFNSLQALNGHKANCNVAKEYKKQINEILITEEESYTFTCNCGRKFKSRRSLNSHAGHCNLYTKTDKTSTYLNKSTNTYICECGYETSNFQSLNGHFSHCRTHRELNNKDCSDDYWNIRNHPGEMQGWQNKTAEEIQEIHNKSGKTYHENLVSGKTKNAWIGRIESVEHRKHIRLGILKAISDRVDNFHVMYSKRGCKYIDLLNEQFGWNLQHAENGGEFEYDGYFIDGYDKERNIAFEYDEKHHYKDINNNILIDKDLYRQNYIIEHLGCEFYRYNEKKHYFYKVN